MADTQVLIVGAGPSGLVLALWLTKLGVRVRIVDRNSTSGTTSRAVAVAAHTLELYQQLDLAETVVAQGHGVRCAHLWVQGKPAAEIPLGVIGENLTPFGVLQMFPQDAHERLLAQKLEQLGVSVERNTELTAARVQEHEVVAQLRGHNGDEQVTAAYLAGCDGARSTVRHCIAAGFEGGTYRQVFYVADAEASGEAANGDLHIDLDEADFLAVFPLSSAGRVRVIGTVRDERADSDKLTFDDVSGQALQNFDLHIKRVNWFSTYHVHHRVSDRFRHGRAFLAGDAAHVHSPVGGQGMNTGIGDAINLAWKLAAVLAGKATDTLLDSFAIERGRFAHRLVATTDRVFTFVTADGRLAEIVRTRLAPYVVPRLLAVERVREFMFRTVAQLALNYRASPLSEGQMGQVHGGDRLPWTGAAASNFGPLREIRWQVHVYGSPGDALSSWCREQNLPLHVFPWQESHAAHGLVRDAIYLLRPDTYVALVAAPGMVSALGDYFRHRGIRI
jgi:2-polyprenyl-6-methoxyphenol hydroxylase-like FAD-dependent oxidoreductase